MPRNDNVHEIELPRYLKRRPFAMQAMLIGLGIALIPLGGLGILWLKKITSKPSDSQSDAESVIKKYDSHLNVAKSRFVIHQQRDDPPLETETRSVFEDALDSLALSEFVVSAGKKFLSFVVKFGQIGLRRGPAPERGQAGGAKRRRRD